MPKAIVTIGLSASGKTTWATEKCRKDKNFININRDDLRFTLTGSDGWKDYKLNKAIENIVTETQNSIVRSAYSRNKNVIISDTNLNEDRRSSLISYLESVGFEVQIKEFDVDLMTAIKRDLHRKNSVGYEVIHRQWGQWLEYIGFEKYIPDEDKPEAIIFDVDGTLAEMIDRKPYDWDKVGTDQPHEVICDMLKAYDQQGYIIIILSGRDGCCETETRKWLHKYELNYDEFYIRDAGDMRKDSIIKSEIFWGSIARRYNVRAVVDDRPQVCRMWRDLGLKVIQVADPYLEF